MTDSKPPAFRLRWRPAAAARMTFSIASALVVEFVVIGVSAVPGALLFQAAWSWAQPHRLLGTVLVCLLIAPGYVIFAVGMVVLSAWSTRILGWRTRPDAEMPLAELGWDLCNWARYIISTHMVDALVGPILKTTPLWSFYMRLNGAKLGRGVYVNSLGVLDHNLLEFGDYVVIGGGVRLSGHTVERGVVRTARVKLGRGVTVGLDTIVGIGVEAGAGCQIGAMSVVPKFSKLEAGATYVGRPVVKIESGNGEPTPNGSPMSAP
jgi:acetyltransferase-like isoleucine patch superfamily enzyme